MVIFGTDHPADRVLQAVHARKCISVIKSTSIFVVEIIPDQIPLLTQLRQADTHDHRADQLFTHKVDSFTKNAAQNCESSARLTVIILKFTQEGGTFPLR